MKKFVLKVTATAKEPEWIFLLKREFFSLEIQQNEIIYNQMILEMHGRKLRHLKLKKVFVQCLERFLQQTPLLEHLELSQVSLMSISKEGIKLPNLKRLRIEDSSDEILTMITGTKQLSTLEVINYENRQILMKFLMEHPNLTHFAIGHRNLDNFFQSQDVLSVPFRLKKLDFAGFPTVVVAYEECLRNFLKLHAPTLDHLRMPCIISNDTCQTVFTQIPNLKTLTYNVESLPMEKSFYCCLTPLEKVTSLRLVGKFPKHEVARLFIVNFPNNRILNMKHLNMSIWSMKFLQKISESQKQIEQLKIPNFFKGAPPNLLFRNLQSLFVYNSQNVSIWKNFVLTHSSTIEELIVDKLHDEGKLKTKDIEDILELPRLRKLTIRSDKKSIDEIWSVIKADYKQLKEVNLRIFIPKNFTSYVEKKIIFPSDKNFWWPEKCDKFIAQTE
jgi:Leucine-rich repeat (LRR) protein